MKLAVVRYNTNGSLDSTFNGNGIALTEVYGPYSLAYAVALQNDGKIVVSGYSGSGNTFTGILARFNKNGSLDNSFSGDGKLNTPFFGTALTLQPDGKIIIAGSAAANIPAIARYNSDGSPDNIFKPGNTTAGAAAASLLVQNDGKILVQGWQQKSDGNYAVFSEYNADGTPVANFFNAGMKTSNATYYRDIAISNNKFYFAASTPSDFGILSRYLLADKEQALPTVSLTSPANNATYLSGGNVYLTAAASDADGSINKVEFYNGTKLLFTSTDSPYTFKWEHVLKGNYTLTAKATDNDGQVTTSDAIHISVVANKPPTVNIVNPANGETFLKGATVHLQAVAQDADGRVGKVEFYNGTILLTTESKVPYTFDWKPGKTGDYVITAKATDNWGASTTSAAINISVVLNQPPTVSITKPSNAQILIAPATIDLEATAGDADGRIVQVSFYSGTTLLTNSEHKAPYTYQWKNVPAGTYTFTAVAKDNWSAETTSAPVTVTVVAPGGRPAQHITSVDKITVINNEAAVQLSPNPAASILQISTKGLQKNKQAIISLISSTGITIKTMQTSSSFQAIQLNVSSLPAGTYIVKIVSGDKVLYGQFVKI